MAGTLIPTGVAHIAQTMDPVLRDSQNIIDRWKTRLPGMSQEIAPKRDIFGRAIVREGAIGPDIASPFFVKTADADPISQELLDIDFTPAKPDRKIMGVDLDPMQYDAYQIVAGRYFRVSLEKFVNNPGWKRVPANIRKDMVEKAFRASRDYGRAQTLKYHPELLEAIAKKKAEDVLGHPIEKQP